MAQFEPVDFDPFASTQPPGQTPADAPPPSLRITVRPVDHDPFATPPKGKSAEDATWQDYVGGTFGGFNKGLGLPIDLVNKLLGTVGLDSKEPFLGSKWFENHGFAPPPPDTIGGRALERIGEEFGGAALPTGGLLKAASKIAPAAAKTAPTLLNGLLSPMAAKPGASLGLEALVTAGSGTGAATAREVAPDSPTTEQLAQIAGGFTPAAWLKVSPTALAAKGISKFKSTFSQEAQEKAGTKIVKDMLGRELTPDAMKSLREADRLATEIPGFQPSIAEATGSPGLIAQQKSLEGKATGQELDRLVGRRQANEQAVADYTKAAAPEAPNNPEFVVNTAKGRIDNLRSGVETQQANVTANRQNLAQRAFPMIDRADAGGTIRTQLQEERAARRAAADDLSARYGLDNVDVTANFTKAANRIKADYAPTTPFDDTVNRPKVLDDIARVGRPKPALDEAGNVVKDAKGNPVMEPAKVTFADLKGLRERVSDDLIDAAGAANPSRKAIRQLTSLKETVDGLIENAGINSGDPTLAARYREFRKAYFDDYIKPFEEGAAYKVRALDGRGFYKTTDERVADAFFKAGDTTSAEKFNSIFANRPEAREALKASAIDNMRADVVRDGVIDPQRFAGWLSRHRSVLERFPEIAAELRTPAAADMAYIRRQQQLAGRQQAIEDKMLTRAVDSYTRGGMTAEGVIDASLKDPRRMEQLVGAVRRTDGALPALRRTLWDRAMGAGNGDAEAITKFITDNGKSLRLLFGAEHLNDIRNIVSARAMLNRVPHPTGSAYVPRPLESVERVIGQQLPQLGNRIFALKSGRVQKEYLLIDMFLRSLRGRVQFVADDALRAALYDPKLARELANSLELGSNSVVKARQMQSRMIDLGIPLLNKESGAPDNKENVQPSP